MMKRDVGRLGEKILGVWGSHVGFTVNPVREDNRGWDYYVEFPVSSEDRPNPKTPLDLETPPIKCYVQVKSTDGRKRKIKDKLDNWIHHVEDTQPHFFLVMEFDGQTDVQRAFLIHVGEELIRRVKKRLRKLGPGKASVLHKKSMQYTFGDDCAIEPCDAIGFMSAVRSYVGDDQDEYAAEKIRIKKEVGYEDQRWRINFTTEFSADSGISPEEYLVEFALGLRPPLDLIHWEQWDVRFGIPSSEPIHESEGGQFRITNREPWGPAEITLRSEDYQITCKLKTDLYIPKGFGHLIDKKFFKYLCKAPYFHFVFWPQGNEMRFQVQYPSRSETHDLFDLFQLAELIGILSRAKEQACKVVVETMSKAGPLPHGFIKPSELPDIEEYSLIEAGLILCAWRIAKYFDIHQGLKLKTRELFEQGKTLVYMAHFLTPGYVPVGVDFSLSKLDESVGTQRCVPILQLAFLGPYRLILVSTLVGTLVPTGEVGEGEPFYRVEASAPGIFTRHVENREDASQFTRKELLEPVVEAFDKRSIDCVILHPMWDDRPLP